MFNRISLELFTAVGCASILAAAVACGQSDQRIEQEPIVNLPTITDDEPELANVDTGSVMPDPVAEQPPAPVAVETAADPLPDDFRGLVRFAKRSSDVDRALEALELARDKNPKSVIPDIESARVLLAAGLSKRARPFAESAVDGDGSSSYAWNTMGRVELAEGDIDGAVASFQRATEENPDNSYAFNNLGLALIRLERYPEAVTALEAATNGNEPTGYMFNNLGMAYENIRRFDLAMAAYRQAIDLGSSKAAENLERLETHGHTESGLESDEDSQAADEAAETESATPVEVEAVVE
ncbi:MAG: tetratricopeptide repeat protein [Deltaproteobacteria bacterium]|nr:tetratricopeptide repeat protein [Deltaproteobacteria bacterium]